jgi:hypothetical protein
LDTAADGFHSGFSHTSVDPEGGCISTEVSEQQLQHGYMHVDRLKWFGPRVVTFFSMYRLFEIDVDQVCQYYRN